MPRTDQDHWNSDHHQVAVKIDHIMFMESQYNITARSRDIVRFRHSFAWSIVDWAICFVFRLFACERIHEPQWPRAMDCDAWSPTNTWSIHQHYPLLIILSSPWNCESIQFECSLWSCAMLWSLSLSNESGLIVADLMVEAEFWSWFVALHHVIIIHPSRSAGCVFD